MSTLIGHMTSSNETISRQKSVTSVGKLQRILTIVACEHSLTEGGMNIVVRLLVVFSKFLFHQANDDDVVCQSTV